MHDLNRDQSQWLAALRGGMFVQGHSVMKRVGLGGRPARYCCLGVACYVLGYDLVPSRYTGDVLGVQAADIVAAASLGIEDVSQAVLPDSINERLGLDRIDDGALAAMNDGGWSFVQIADLAEFAWMRGRKISEVYDRMVELAAFLFNLRELDTND